MRKAFVVFFFLILTFGNGSTAAPLVTVGERTFSAVNVRVVGLEARAVGSNDFIAFATPFLDYNLLEITNDGWASVIAPLPTGSYAAIRLAVDVSQSFLLDSVTGLPEPLFMADDATQIEIRFAPAMSVDGIDDIVLTRWNMSIAFDTEEGAYVLSSAIKASPLNAFDAPIAINALPGRVAAIDASAASLRVELAALGSALYLVRTFPSTIIRTHRGSPIPLVDLQAGDRILVTGAMDLSGDISADRLVKLPAR